MDIIAPLAKTGAISEVLNLWLAIPIGFVFGFALFHAGFTDSRRIAWAFYFKDVGVPVVMFSAIVTGMLGLWGLSLMGLIDISRVFLLPTYLIPMAVGGLIFGWGMAIGGYCPGTAIAAVATGKIDGIVFVVGFLIGSLVFGDFFPVWGDFYSSDYRAVYRLDELLGVSLGVASLLVVIAAVAGCVGMIFVQSLVWEKKTPDFTANPFFKLQAGLIGSALVVGLAFAFFPTESFIDDHVEPPYYIIPRTEAALPGPDSDEQLAVAAVAGATP